MRTKTLLAFTAGSALATLYTRSVWIVAAAGLLANAGAFQFGMIMLQILKLIVILSFRRLRAANLVMIFDFFSLELLLLPVLVLVGLLTGDASVTGFEYGLFSTWPLSLALVFVPFAAFRVTRGVLRDELPSSVIPGAVLVTGLAAFSAQVVSTSPSGATADFTGALVGGFVSSAAKFPALGLDPIIALALPVLYVSLAVYAAIGRIPTGAAPGPALLIALFSSFVVLLWTATVVSIPGAVLLFALPTFGLLAVVWWFGRGQ
jgi:hypothetical protein